MLYCIECNYENENSLVDHINKEHGSVKDYLTKYPNGKVVSKEVFSELVALSIAPPKAEFISLENRTSILNSRPKIRRSKIFITNDKKDVAVEPKRVAKDHWGEYRVGDVLRITDPKDTNKVSPDVTVIASRRFASGKALKVQGVGKVWSSASPMVSYMFKGRRIASGWQYLTKV